jgi:hypothetical protein
VSERANIVRYSSYWRERAEEARALAAGMSPDYQRKMLEISKVYDDLARQATPTGLAVVSRNALA